jgi:glutamate racemase
VAVVDSASATAEEVAAFLDDREQRAVRPGGGRLELLVTDVPKSFADVASRFLGGSPTSVQQIDL